MITNSLHPKVLFYNILWYECFTAHFITQVVLADVFSLVLWLAVWETFACRSRWPATGFWRRYKRLVSTSLAWAHCISAMKIPSMELVDISVSMALCLWPHVSLSMSAAAPPLPLNSNLTAVLTWMAKMHVGAFLISYRIGLLHIYRIRMSGNAPISSFAHSNGRSQVSWTWWHSFSYGLQINCIDR